MTYPRWPEGPQRPIPPNKAWLVVSLVCIAVALALIVTMLLGCSGSSPSEVPGATVVETAYGSVAVLGSLDPGEVRDGVERGYDRVAGQGYTLTASGLTVIQGDGSLWHGRHYPERDLIEVAQASDLPHEIGHRASHQLVNPAWCHPRVWHDVDLDCQPMR